MLLIAHLLRLNVLGIDLGYIRKLEAERAEEARKAAAIYQAQRATAKATLSNMVHAGTDAKPAELVERDQPAEPEPATNTINPEKLCLFVVFSLLALLVAKTLCRQKREATMRKLSGKYLADGMEALEIYMADLLAPTPAPAAEPIALPTMESVRKEEAPSTTLTPVAAITEFYNDATERLLSLRAAVQSFSAAADDATRQSSLLQVRDELSWFPAHSRQWELRPIHQVTSALELLVNRLVEKPKDLTTSTVRTIDNALDLLVDILVPGIRPDILTNPPVQVLAVDDDPLCLRAVTFALQKAALNPEQARSGEEALTLATAKSYDVVLMDVQMPGMDGLEACTKIRSLARNTNTPVVFVTVHADFQTRTNTTLAGGTDLIAKPFLIFEITVKTITFALGKRLLAAEAAKVELARTAQLSKAA